MADVGTDVVGIFEPVTAVFLMAIGLQRATNKQDELLFGNRQVRCGIAATFLHIAAKQMGGGLCTQHMTISSWVPVHPAVF